jgi:hypothetical protein
MWIFLAPWNAPLSCEPKKGPGTVRQQVAGLKSLAVTRAKHVGGEATNLIGGSEGARHGAAWWPVAGSA